MAASIISVDELRKYVSSEEEPILFYIQRKSNDNGSVPVTEGFEGCGDLRGPDFYRVLYGLERRKINGISLLNFVSIGGNTLYSVNSVFHDVVSKLAELRNPKK